MPVPIISVAQMREWERATWASGQTEEAVIARVGKALARRLTALTRSGDRILFLAGKGHNGDDARAMPPHLSDREIQLLNVSDPDAALDELHRALRLRPRLIVDGLFGIGLSRALDPAWCKLIEEVNAAGVPIVAVDVPSGLDAETGEPMPVAIRAAITMTVGAPKRGFFTQRAAEYVGRIEIVSDVGLIACPLASELQCTVREDFAAFPPQRPAASHKGSFGHAAIVAGSMGYHGASVLAARGAQRARPGLVTLFTQPDTYAPVASQAQAVMVHPWSGHVDLGKFSTLLFGPGLASPTLVSTVRQSFEAVWSHALIPIIADASALDWLPRRTEQMNNSCRVITPHPGEAARLLNCSSADVQRDRVAAVRELSSRFGTCWVALKGQHTIIGCAHGPVFVNSSGNPGLAQGGSGDLLAGFITGFLAQPILQTDPLRALRYAVWEHGAAADRLSEKRNSWTVEDLAAELGG